MEIITSTPTELDIVRSWKDARYRRSLSDEQLQTLPGHPSGPSLLTDQELRLAGGVLSEEDDDFAIGTIGTTAPQCTLYTFHSWKACGC